MGKILTVSIAAYNVEQVLKRALESCVVPEIIDDIEVIIENDGSTDGTAKIAEEYQNNYPETFRLINKNNGGYGTTVNRSVKEANGKYFKLLDGDDWFDKEGLSKLVSFLRESDADWVVTRRITVDDATCEKNDVQPGWLQYCDRVYETKEISDSGFSSYIGMWHITVRTEILKHHLPELPSHTLYTDQLYVFFQMPYIKRIAFCDSPVYYYRIGREDQSVSRASRTKHSKEAIDNLNIMLEQYICESINYGDNKSFMMYRLTQYYIQGIKLYCLLPVSNNNRKAIKSLEHKCKEGARDVYDNAQHYARRMFSLLRFSNYYAYYLFAWKGVELGF